MIALPPQILSFIKELSPIKGLNSEKKVILGLKFDDQLFFMKLMLKLGQLIYEECILWDNSFLLIYTLFLDIFMDIDIGFIETTF